MLHHGQVVRDKQITQVEFFLQFGEQVEHTCAHTYVERRNRLIKRNNVVAVPKNVANFGAFGFTSIDWTKVGFTKSK